MTSQAGSRNKSCFSFGTRHGVIILAFLYGSLLYALRFNLSIAIVVMVEEDKHVGNEGISRVNDSLTGTSHEATQICPLLVNEEEKNSLSKGVSHIDAQKETSDPKFRWNERDQGLILGCFFWGYVLSQFPSGLIAQKYGSKWVMGLGMLCTGLLSMVLPHAAYSGGRDLVIFIRILQGISEGFTVPALIVLLSKWMPPQERARLTALCFAGMPFGTAALMIISGPLITTFGWPSVFYLPGILTILWFICWTIKIHSSPEEHPTISINELNFMRESKQAALKEGKLLHPDQPLNFTDVPWRKIVSSVPVWSVFLSQFFNAWGHNMLKAEGPKYLHSALHFDIHSNGYFSASPYIFQCFFSMAVGRMSDFLIEKKICTMLTARRFCNTIGQWGAALSFGGIVLAGCNRPLAVFCYIMSGMVNGAMLSGTFVNIIDISPNYSGAIEGVINSISNIAGFGAPFIAGLILYNMPTMLGWSFVFLIPVISNVIGNFAFLLGSSVEVQPWDEIKTKKEKSKENKELSV